MKAWSHSSLKSYEQCPKRYFLTSVEKKFVEPPSEMMDWGKNVHSAFENFYKRQQRFPMGMKQFEEIATRLRAKPSAAVEVMTETKLALTKDLEPCGYFDKNVWVRCVVDYGIIKRPNALIVDWKTGKRKDDDDQLALMAGVMFAQDSEIKQITSTFVWLQEPPSSQIKQIVFHRDRVGEIWERFMRRVEVFQQAHATADFPAKPSGLCKRYCPVKSCPYHGT